MHCPPRHTRRRSASLASDPLSRTRTDHSPVQSRSPVADFNVAVQCSPEWITSACARMVAGSGLTVMFRNKPPIRV
eukprot:2499754-Rhodomonas_salina.2